MEPSFIPKRQITKPAFKPAKLGFISFASVLIFLISLALFGGAFVYKRVLNTQIEELNAALEKVKADFEPVLVDELIQTSKTIEFSKKILAQHGAVSSIFAFLGDLTLENVGFSSFGYSREGEKYSVSMRGEAVSYTAAAQQAAIFEASPFVSQVIFSNFSLIRQKGNVGFDVLIILKPELLKFKI